MMGEGQVWGGGVQDRGWLDRQFLGLCSQRHVGQAVRRTISAISLVHLHLSTFPAGAPMV